MRKWSTFILLIILTISCAKEQIYSPAVVSIRNSTFIKEQQKNVKSILWTGKLSIKNLKNNLDANILVIGQRSPFMVRIEITNWLSGPIFYIVIRETNMFILSIKEKKYYLARLDNAYFLKFFPPYLNQEQIWAILRGMPIFSNKKNIKTRFSLQDTIVTLSKQIEIRFKNYRTYHGLIFAKDISIYYYPTNTTWKLNIKDIQFNKDIPEKIFKLNIPSDFQIIKYQVPSS